MSLPLGMGLSVLLCIPIIATSTQLSGFLLVSFVTHAVFGLCLPSILVSYPRMAFFLTLVQGMLNNAISVVIIRILAYWTPDNENTVMSSIFFGAYITGRMCVALIVTPIANYVHWSAPSLIFGTLLICVTAVLLVLVSMQVFLMLQ